MTRSFRLAVLALSLNLFIGQSGLAAQEDRSAYDAIAEDMEGLRELPLVDPLDLEFRTRDELLAELNADIGQEDATGERDSERRVLVAFGFIAADQNPQQLYIDLLGEQVAGYYDSETNQMVVVSDDVEDIGAGEAVAFAHETVHALQDQNTGLEDLVARRQDASSDESLAITALAEGDAMTATIDYLLANPEVARDYIEEIADTPTDQLESAPAIFVETLSFPYAQGQAFVQELYDAGGWEAVNEAYTNPPVTTEQILHPEKYFEGEGAVVVDVPDISADMGPGWELLDEDTMGEFQVSILLGDAGMNDEQVELASEGWGGDQYVVCAAGDDMVVAWQSAWDSDDDADQFGRALANREAERLGAEVVEDGDTYTVSADGQAVRVEVNGDKVTYLQAPDEQLLDRALVALA